MPFEEIDADTAKFFNSGGELPVELQTAQDEAAAAARAATEALAAEEAAKLKVDPVAVVVDPVEPVVPQRDPLYERLLAESDARGKALQDQLDALQKQVEAKSAPVAPDPNTDPLGFLAHKIEAVGKDLADSRELQAKLQEAKTQQDNAQQFLNLLNKQVGEFMQTHADYQDAYKHVVGLRQREYATRGMTPDEIRQQISTDEMQLTQTAMRAGKNPAEVVYTLAQQYGFKAVPPVVKVGADGKPVVAATKLDTLLKGQELAGKGERGVPPTQASVENLKDMTDKELNALVADEEAWNQMMGGRSKSIF